MRGLHGKVFIIAGGASGLGAATAHRLAEGGAKVIVGDLNEQGAKTTVDAIAAAGGAARSFTFDITDEGRIDEMVAYTIAEFGGVDGLYNSVADLRASIFAADTDLVNIDLNVWRRTFEVNLTGFLLTMRHTIPAMIERGGGSIVNCSSVAAFQGEPIRPAYAASKAGIVALTRHVAAAYGKQGIRCNAVAPGPVPTEGTLGLATKLFGDTDQWFDYVRKNIATHSHRMGKADDIAATVAFLLSEDGSWINGQCFSVDGGQLFR
jgi:NAD(P)-dependent dehydrogenase (short-subunit alcohol dehydrogenase family)